MKSHKSYKNFEEGSLSYPGIKAMAERSKEIEVKYLDINWKPNSMSVESWLAAVIQYEVDYLDGKVFLDYISPTKRKMPLKKMEKHIKK